MSSFLAGQKLPLFAGLIMLIALPVAAYMVQSQTGSFNIAPRAREKNEIINLLPSTTSPIINQPFEVTIDINSPQNTLSTDIVLKYDPQILQLTSITKGTLYPGYSDTDVSKQAPGTIKLSAVSDFQTGIIASGTFATLTFTPKSLGTTEISLAYDPQSTTLTTITPFDGSTQNLLTQAPSPLPLTISSRPKPDQVPTGQVPTGNLPGGWRILLVIGVISLLVIAIGLLMKRKGSSSSAT